MRALYIVFPILCILAIAYRYYSAFIAARIMSLDDSRLNVAAICALLESAHSGKPVSLTNSEKATAKS